MSNEIYKYFYPFYANMVHIRLSIILINYIILVITTKE
jgi:hypothetical protein